MFEIWVTRLIFAPCLSIKAEINRVRQAFVFLKKRGRNNVLVKSMGSSRDEKEIERMVEQAKVFIKRRTGSLGKER